MTVQHSPAPNADREEAGQPAGAASQLAECAPRLDLSTKLALERTRAAYERTMMAWVRTATSLITFGFTVYKFFQLQRYGDFEKRHRIGPREFGLALVSIGLFSLLLATLENRHNTQALRAEYPGMPPSMATIVAALISLLGILGLIVMLLRE